MFDQKYLARMEDNGATTDNEGSVGEHASIVLQHHIQQHPHHNLNADRRRNSFETSPFD